LKLSSEEIEKIESAIAIATNLVYENNQQVAADVLQDHLKELKSWMEQIIAKNFFFFFSIAKY
jgi:thioredoxin-like negative regulator of GroEL